MNNDMESSAEARRPTRRAWPMAVVLVCCVSWIVASLITIARVLTSGRGGYAITYDDVVYIRVGQYLLHGPQGDSVFSRLAGWIEGAPHSPLTEFTAFVAHAIPIPSPLSVYVLNSIIASGLLLMLTSTIAKKWALRFALASVLTVSPLGYLLANEFRPDLWFAVVAAILLVGNIPYSSGPSHRSGISPLTSSVLAVSLLFIKPSWLALAAVTTLGSLAGVLYSGWPGGDRRSSHRTPVWVGAIALYVAGFLTWWMWLRQHFFDYVFSALNEEYRLAGSRADAVFDSIAGARAYLGDSSSWLVPALIVVATFAVVTLFKARDRRKFGISLSFSMALPAVALMNLAATWWSRHASPFQGLFTYFLLIAWMLVVVCIALRYWLRACSPALWAKLTLGTALLLAVPITALAATQVTSLAYPEQTKLPNASVVTLSEAISDACKSMSRCASSESPNRVLVTFAEDVNSTGLEYYLNRAGTSSIAIGADMGATVPSEVVRDADAFEFIVSRAHDFPANRLPLNMLQDEIDGILAEDKSFSLIADSRIPAEYRVWQHAPVK